MSSPVHTISAALSVDAAQRILEAEGVHYLVLEHDRELLGVVCACDLEAVLPDSALRAACRHPVVFVGSDTELDEIRAVMDRCGVGSLLVIDDGELKGIVTCSDLISIGVWNRDSWECLSCGAHHQLRDEGAGARFCDPCRETTNSRGVREFYFTLGGGD